MEVLTTPKRTATSPLGSSPKRIELPVFPPSSPPGLNNEPINVQLPVWDPAQHYPGILREGRNDLVISVTADLPLNKCDHDEEDNGDDNEGDETEDEMDGNDAVQNPHF